jgi:hypothetical protein
MREVLFEQLRDEKFAETRLPGGARKPALDLVDPGRRCRRVALMDAEASARTMKSAASQSISTPGTTAASAAQCGRQ